MDDWIACQDDPLPSVGTSRVETAEIAPESKTQLQRTGHEWWWAPWPNEPKTAGFFFAVKQGFACLLPLMVRNSGS